MTNVEVAVPIIQLAVIRVLLDDSGGRFSGRDPRRSGNATMCSWSASVNPWLNRCWIESSRAL